MIGMITRSALRQNAMHSVCGTSNIFFEFASDGSECLYMTIRTELHDVPFTP